MTCRTVGRRPAYLLVAFVALVLAAPVFGQSTGMVKGKVVDAQGQPVEGAKVLIEYQEGVARKHETKSNKKGEFIQIGLMPGKYKVTATKEDVGAQAFDIAVRLGQTAEVNFALTPVSGMTKEEATKLLGLKKAFDD